MTPRSLHDYQADGLAAVREAMRSRDWRRYAVLWATGAGKTALVLTLLSEVHGRDYTHVIVTSTQKHILDGFTNPAVRVWRAGDAIYDVTGSVPEAVDREFLISYLGLPRGKVVACLNNTIAGSPDVLDAVRFYVRARPDFAKGKLLVCDEAHWASSDRMGEFVDAWEAAGGETLKLTATPDRGDRRDVVRQYTFTIARTLSQQMGKYAPSCLKHEIVAVDGGYEHDSDSVGIPVSPAVIDAMVRHWSSDGRPKLVVRVRNYCDGEDNKNLVGRIVSAFREAGARVLDATGSSERAAREVRDALRAEREAGAYHDSRYDVVVGIQRVAEGMDWPLCSHVYLLGVPRRLPTISQMIGRAMRLRRHDGYPERWRDASKVVLFVSTSVKDVRAAHAKHTVLVCCFLSDLHSSNRWTTLWELTRLLEERGSPADRAAVAAKAGVPDEARAKINAHWLAIKHAGGDVLDRRIRPGQISERIKASLAENGDESAIEYVDAVIHENFAQDHPRMRERYAEELMRAWDGGLRPGDAHLRALETVSKEFQDEAMEHPSILSEAEGVLESVERQIFNTTGERIEKLTARMKQALPPLSEVKILQATLRYMQIRGAVPDPRCKSDVDPNDPVESFAAYHEALLSGSRGLGRPREGGYWEFLAEKLSRSRDWVSDYGRIWGAYRERNKYADEREQAVGREEFLARKACEFGRPDFVRYGKAFWVARKVGEDAARKMGLIAAYRLAAAAGSEKGLSGVAEELSAASTRLEREDFVELALRTADELREDRSA